MAAAARYVQGIWVAVVSLYLVSGLLSPASVDFRHTMDVLQVASFLGISAVGQTLVVLTGGIDLTVAGVIQMANIVSAMVMRGRPENALMAAALPIVLGAFIGLLNGILVTRVRIVPLIATLAMNSVLFGAALIYTNGAPSGALAAPLTALGRGRFGAFPVSALVWLGWTVLLYVLTRFTVYGRQLYAVGANPRAAYLSAVQVERVTTLAYILSSVSSAMAGLMLTAYIGLPSLGIGDQFLLNSVAAVVVGGTALTGGEGSVVATAGGALFITQVNSLTNMLRISSGAQFVVQGVVIASGIAISRLRGIQARFQSAREAKSLGPARVGDEPEST